MRSKKLNKNQTSNMFKQLFGGANSVAPPDLSRPRNRRGTDGSGLSIANAWVHANNIPITKSYHFDFNYNGVYFPFLLWDRYTGSPRPHDWPKGLNGKPGIYDDDLMELIKAILDGDITNKLKTIINLLTYIINLRLKERKKEGPDERHNLYVAKLIGMNVYFNHYEDRPFDDTLKNELISSLTTVDFISLFEEQQYRERGYGSSKNKAPLNKASRKQASRKQASRKQASRKQASRKQASRKQASRKQASRKQAPLNKASRKQASRKQASRKQAPLNKASRKQASIKQA